MTQKLSSTQETTQSTSIKVQGGQPKAISPDLFGIFFEDLNSAADGGLYAELIQNRSFEYSPADRRDWNFLTGWDLVQDRKQCSLALATAEPIHPNNPHYLVLNLAEGEGSIGLRNCGFDGIPLKFGESYEVSCFARALSGQIERMTVRLESRTGEDLGHAKMEAPSAEWKRYSTTLTCSGDEPDGRFVLEVSGQGSVALDVISLFPQQTFRGRANGLRADLAQAIADLKPRFVRFPGGCLAHGDGLDNMYRWKDTIGPVETRKEQPNIWNYHQSVGLGYFEYFQFCEDVGAKPLPVVPAGVCCQNSGAKHSGCWEQGQQGLPLEKMPAYIQEVLDLIEWANGPADSFWGSKRAEAGHPEPFHLEYLGVGNEDQITPIFKERFTMIYEAVKAKHPEIIVVGTTGPRTEGEDYEEGWKIANELRLEMVDEHGYQEPDWFWNNLDRFDHQDRHGSAIYIGEYAAHDVNRKNTLRSALAEAAYMTSLERNGDIVRLTSYAPLLAKQGHFHWVPDMIYFDNSRIGLSVNYFVQQLFGQNAGDSYLPTELSSDGLAASCVRDSSSGNLILKVVSRNDVTVKARIEISGALGIEPEAQCTVLAGEPDAENRFGNPPTVVPMTSEISAGPRFEIDLPAHSFTVLRLKARPVV